MVDLPSGKMKSREGTVVDADDLMEEMVQEARKAGEELSKLDEFRRGEDVLFETIGHGRAEVLPAEGGSRRSACSSTLLPASTCKGTPGRSSSTPTRRIRSPCSGKRESGQLDRAPLSDAETRTEQRPPATTDYPRGTRRDQVAAPFPGVLNEQPLPSWILP
jgi:hypothetical protein